MGSPLRRAARCLAASILVNTRAAEALFGRGSTVAQVGPQPLTFFGIADWGGQNAPPYTTAGQLAAAEAMGTVAAETGDHPAFVLGAGDNFYMDGLPGSQPIAALHPEQHVGSK